MATRKRTLSGIKPSGTPHLGNYLGMIRPALRMQETHETFYFIADYHALTTMRDAESLRGYTFDLVATFAALGMDFEHHTFFRQSDVPQVTELSWFLSCITPVGMLERAHAYKDSGARGAEVHHGLFAYPVLMAADILIYDAHEVPVGQDQKQHLEMTRDIAQRFNRLYGDTFVVPEARVSEQTALVPGLDGRKMSKSYHNELPLFAPPEVQRKALMRMVTDSRSVDEPKDPHSCPVFGIFRQFASAEQIPSWEARYRAGGIGYGEMKQATFEVLNAHLKPYREHYTALRADVKRMETILHEGAERARSVAQATLTRARHRIGLGDSL